MKKSIFSRWFGRSTTLAAFAGLGVAVLLPPTGLGVPLCWLHRLTGIPCPGCGIMRSLSSAARGMFEASFDHHPFGMPLFVAFVVIAAVRLLPAARRRGLEVWVTRHERAASWATALFLGAFVTFGAVRALAHACS